MKRRRTPIRCARWPAGSGSRAWSGSCPRRPGARQRRAPRTPEAVRQEVDRLKALYPGFHYRELARILSYKFDMRIDDKTAKQLWERSPVPPQSQLPPVELSHPARPLSGPRAGDQALFIRAGISVSISRFLHVSRPTIDRWIARFEAEHFAGLLDKSRAPKAPRGKSGCR